MWQEIVAIDTKLNEHRMMEAKDLRPLYLKRRLQLLQSHGQRSHPQEVDPDQYVMRNKKYISLRVKLLKKQFGLPADLVSLKSLSLSPALASTASAADHEYCYNGVHNVISLTCPLAKGSRLIFKTLDEEQGQQSLIYGLANGFILCNELVHPALSSDPSKSFRVSANAGSSAVTDFDINETNELLVGAALDGSFVVWNLQKNQELRRIQIPSGIFVSHCRFLPRNNNLIICALSNGVLQVLNVSTGKFNQDAGGAPMLGATMTVTLNATGSVLWAGNDRGYIESFRIDSTTGKLSKGCRLQAGKQPVKSLTARTCSQLCRDPCLLATFEMSDALALYRITDDYGSISPFKSFSSGSGSHLSCAVMAPILSYR